MDTLETIHDQPRPFLEHLADLRRALVQALAVFAAASALVIPLAPTVLRILKWPLRNVVADHDTFLVSYEVAAGFMVMLRLVFSAGLLLAAPWMLFIFGRFVFPGLTALERRTVRRYAGLAVLMFFLGAGFAFGLILPMALRVMLRVHQWMGIPVANVLATNYISFATQLLLGFGLAFEMPVVLLAMGQAGLVNAAQLRARRRHVAVTLLIVAMLMTPQDIATQLLMALPLFLLFEGCIFLIAREEKAKRAFATKLRE